MKRKVVVGLVLATLLLALMTATAWSTLASETQNAVKDISCMARRTVLVLQGTRMSDGFQVVKFTCHRHSQSSKAPDGGVKIGTGQSKSYWCPYYGYRLTATWYSRRWVKVACTPTWWWTGASSLLSGEPVIKAPLELEE